MIKNFKYQDVTKRDKDKTMSTAFSGKHQILTRDKSKLQGYTDLEDGVSYQPLYLDVLSNILDKTIFSRQNEVGFKMQIIVIYAALKYVKIPNTDIIDISSG